MNDTTVQIHRAGDTNVTYSDSQNHQVYFTPAALKFLQTKVAEQACCIGIRLDIEKKGCSGLAYVIEYVEQAQDNDADFSSENSDLCIFIANREFDNKYNTLKIVNQVTVDYTQQGLNKKLVFHNPAATR